MRCLGLKTFFCKGLSLDFGIENFGLSDWENALVIHLGVWWKSGRTGDLGGRKD